MLLIGYPKKDIACLFQSIVIGKVNVVKISGNRCTLSIKFKIGRLYGVVFHVSYSSGGQSDDLNDVCQAAQISLLIV
ncbi:hypothetical protein DKG79_11680 [Escherichia fergusonii]|nr:hypothetical protein DKG79_11680 [Escherichia fergusonii]